MLVASGPLPDGTTTNHVIQLQTTEGKYKSFCSSEFDLPSGTWNEVMSDSIQRSRICQHCVHRMNILRLNLPDEIPVGWRVSPYDLA